MSKSIQLSFTYHFPVEHVWQALTSKEAMSEWLMPCDIEPIVGHTFQFKTKSFPGFDGTVHCEVLEVIEHELLSFSWSGGTIKNTVVTFSLHNRGTSTLLEFEHKGFEGFLNQLIVKRILSNGWKTKILVDHLPKYLTAHV